MGLGGLLLGGVLSGVGRGMEMQAVAQQKEAEAQRADDALMRRQTALAKYQADLQDARDKTQHGYKLDEIKTELGVRRILAKEDDERGLASAIAKADHDFKLEIKKMEKAHGYKLSEAQYESGLAIARDAAAAGRDIDHYEVDSQTGELVGFTKNGTAFRKNNFKPLRQKGGSGGILDEYDDGGDGTTGSGSSSGGVSAKTYTMAEAAETAKNRGIPIEQVHSIMRKAGYKLTQ